MKTDFLTNFVDNCNFTVGKDGCLMRQHFPSIQEQEAKRKYWSFHEHNFRAFRVFSRLSLVFGLLIHSFFLLFI